ncbi:MAG: DUF4293 family protein [Bacteroidota bacterium]|nr:DUF4293 family protein [Bacteroidota bacterium]
MIQRIQSILLLFASILSLILIFYFPVLLDAHGTYLLKDNFSFVRLLLLLSAGLSFFAIFQFKNRKRQILIALFSRLMITISLFLIIVIHKQDKEFDSGLFLLIVPFLLLWLATYYIKKDEKIVRSADRLR